MRRAKQRCIAAGVKAVELLGHEGACVHDVAHSSDGYHSSRAYHHFISMLPLQTVETEQDKHKGRDAYSSISHSIHIHPDPAHPSAGGSG